MSSSVKPVHAWIGVVVLHAAQTTYYYPRLPDVVAQHFGAGGQANGWAPRDFFFIFSWVMLLGISAVFMLTPRLLRKLPISMINLPNKEYWLAPERKDDSLRFIERRMEWMGVMTVGFIVLVRHLAIRGNLNTAHRLENGPFIVLLSLFVGATVWWILRIYRRFPRTAPGK